VSTLSPNLFLGYVFEQYIDTNQIEGVDMSWFNEGISKGYFFLRILVSFMLIIGVVTAYLNISFGGFSPIYWFFLALCGLFDIVINVLLQCERYCRRSKKDQRRPSILLFLFA